METTWQEVTLYGYDHRAIGKARVPKNPFLPSILLWSNRYFRLGSSPDTYLEARCHQVPIDNMYSLSGAPLAAPHASKAK